MSGSAPFEGALSGADHMYCITQRGEWHDEKLPKPAGKDYYGWLIFRVIFPGCLCCPRRGSYHITVRLYTGSLTLFDIVMIVLRLRSHQTCLGWFERSPRTLVAAKKSWLWSACKWTQERFITGVNTSRTNHSEAWLTCVVWPCNHMHIH